MPLLGSKPVPRRGSWVPCARDGLKPGCLVAVGSCGDVVGCLCPSCESEGVDYRGRMIDGGGFAPDKQPCPFPKVPYAPPSGRQPCGPSYNWKGAMSDGAYTATFVPQRIPAQPAPQRPSRPSRPPGMSTTLTSRPGRVGLLGTYGPNNRMLHGGPLVAGAQDLAICGEGGHIVTETVNGKTVSRCVWPKASTSGGMRFRRRAGRGRRRSRRGIRFR